MNAFSPENLNSKRPAEPDLIANFKSLIKSDKQQYYDVFQFVEIIDFFLDFGDFEYAEVAINMSVNQHPHNAELLVRKAEYLFHECDFVASMELLEELRQSNPSNVNVYVTLGAIYERMGNPKKAIHYLEIALELVNKEEADFILQALGNDYLKLDMEKEAVSYFKEALFLDSRNEDLLKKVFNYHFKHKLFAEGVEFFTNLSNSDPYNKWVWYYIAKLELPQSKLTDSHFNCELALAIDESFEESVKLKGQICFEQRKYEEAIASFKDYMNLNGVTATTLTKIGECYELNKQWDHASFYFKKAISLDPELSEAYVGYGISRNMLCNDGEGIKYLIKAINLKPNEGEYWHILALSYSKSGDFEKAVHSFEKSIELDKTNKITWLDFIDFLKENFEFESGYSLIERGYSIFPKDEELSIRKTAFLLELGRKNHAQDSLKLLLTKDKSFMNKMVKYYPKIEQVDELKDILSLYL